MKNLIIVGDSFCANEGWPNILADKLDMHLLKNGAGGQSWWPNRKFLTKLTTEQWGNSDTIIFCHTNAERILSSNEEAHWIDWSKASPSSENELEKAIALHLKYFYNSEILHWSVKKWYEEINQSWSRTRTIHLHCFSTSWELRHLLTGLHVGPDLSSISLNEIDCPSMLYKDHRCNHLNKFNNKELAEQLCSLILNYDQGQVMLDTSKFQLVANTNI